MCRFGAVVQSANTLSPTEVVGFGLSLLSSSCTKAIVGRTVVLSYSH